MSTSPGPFSRPRQDIETQAANHNNDDTPDLLSSSELVSIGFLFCTLLFLTVKFIQVTLDIGGKVFHTTKGTLAERVTHCYFSSLFRGSYKVLFFIHSIFTYCSTQRPRETIEELSYFSSTATPHTSDIF